MHRALAPWAGGEPRVVAARAGERAGIQGVDEWLDADLDFPGGATGTVRCSMTAAEIRMTARIIGSRGEVSAANFVLPHRDDRVTVTAGGAERVEELGRRPSYAYQLEAFAGHLRGGEPVLTDADDAVATAELIDACYGAAGLPPRARTRL